MDNRNYKMNAIACVKKIETEAFSRDNQARTKNRFF